MLCLLLSLGVGGICDGTLSLLHPLFPALLCCLGRVERRGGGRAERAGVSGRDADCLVIWLGPLVEPWPSF